jgi:hypothetical protein
VFKGPEIDELRRLASALPALRRWRRSGLAVLCFGPVQNLLVQMKRQAYLTDRLAITVSCEVARGYAEELAILIECERTCHDVFALYRRIVNGEDQTASPLPMEDVETDKRIARMMRRDSFASLEPTALRQAIAENLPPLAIVAARMGRVLERLRAWPEDKRDAAFLVDRTKFAETFRRLYCETRS